MSNEDGNEKKYAPVPLGKFNPEEELATDIFLKINEKYIKFKEKNDTISVEKYDLFLARNVGEVYITVASIPIFMEWLKKSQEASVNELVEKVGEENRDLAERREALKEKVFETFADESLSDETVEILQEQTEEFVKELVSRPLAQSILAKLSRHSESVAEHSLNVANMAVLMGLCLGEGKLSVLENLYLAGLFHDYGKAKIPPEILENKGNVKYSQAIQDHPKKGAKALKKIGTVPDQVIQMVLQHHEQFNGQGFPMGLEGEKIPKWSCVLSIANIFDNILQENKERPSQMYKVAIKNLEYDRGKNFNPEYVPRILDGLKLAYGGLTRDRET